MNPWGRKTEVNLEAAIEGESRATRRDLSFAQKADVEGDNYFAAVPGDFLATIDRCSGHDGTHAVKGDYRASDCPMAGADHPHGRHSHRLLTATLESLGKDLD